MNAEYKIIEETSIEELERRISYYISYGWLLQGGLCVYFNLLHQQRFAQALYHPAFNG